MTYRYEKYVVQFESYKVNPTTGERWRWHHGPFEGASAYQEACEYANKQRIVHDDTAIVTVRETKR